jgi:hypothetical protein
VHDFKHTAIKVVQIDRQDPTRRTRVLLPLAHIARLVPRHYVESGGKQMITTVDVDDPKASDRGLKRSFLILDDIGGQFESQTASEAAQAILEQMWTGSA